MSPGFTNGYQWSLHLLELDLLALVLLVLPLFRIASTAATVLPPVRLKGNVKMSAKPRVNLEGSTSCQAPCEATYSSPSSASAPMLVGSLQPLFFWLFMPVGTF